MKEINVLSLNGVNIEKALESLGTMERYNSALAVFNKTLEPNLEKLTAFRDDGNLEQYAILIHALKSEFKYFGFEELTDLAYEHELKSKEGNMSYISENFDTLKTKIKAVIKLVREYLGKDEVAKPMYNNSLDKNLDKTIIIVDDSAVTRDFIASIFKDKYQVVTHEDGSEAIEFVRKNPQLKIAGMFLDLDMPNINGYFILDFFKPRDMFVKVPICIITGDESDKVNTLIDKYPIVDVLRKPFNEEAIIEAVRKFN